MTSVKEVVSTETKNIALADVDLKDVKFSENYIKELLDESKIFATSWAVKTFIQILNPDAKELICGFNSSCKSILERLKFYWDQDRKQFKQLVNRFPMPKLTFNKNTSFSQALDTIITSCFTFDKIGKTERFPVTDIDLLDRFNGTINSHFLTGYYTSIKNDYAKGNLVHICKNVDILQYVKSSWRNINYLISEKIFHRISCLVENFIEYYNTGLEHNIYEIENMVDVFFPGDSKSYQENIKVNTVDAIFKQLDIELKDFTEVDVPMFLVMKAIHKNTISRGIGEYSKYCNQYCYSYSVGYVLGCLCKYVCIGTVNTDDITNEEGGNTIEIVYNHAKTVLSCPYDPKKRYYREWNINLMNSVILFAEQWNSKTSINKLPKYLNGKFCLAF